MKKFLPGFVLVAAIAAGGAPAAAQTLRQAADAAGKLVGAAAAAGPLASGENYQKVLAREFSQLTCNSEMKFAKVHPGPAAYDFSAPDAMVAFAQAHGMKVRGHTLVWHNEIPDWVTGGRFTPDQLSEILRDHITTEVSRYAGKVYAWDVVNEAFSSDGSLRSTVWYDAPGIGFAGQGTRYIEQAFRWARAADPHALLFYNDYGAERASTKSDAIYAMVREFRARGVPIDGVGLQAHLSEHGVDAAGLSAEIERFAALGVQVQITELEVHLSLASGPATPSQLENQARIYHDVVAACVSHPACTAVTAWGFTDKHMHVPASGGPFGSGGLFDSQYAPKPAYFSFLRALRGG